MNTFKKTLATTISILFVITAVAAILLFNFDRRAFTAETYQRAFAREDFYDKIPSLLAQSMASGADANQPLLGLQGLSQETWESFIRALLPPEVLKPIGDDVLNSTFSYLNMESDSIQVDLTPVKARMAGDAGAQAAISLLNTLPGCTLDQSAMIMFGMVSGDQIQLCNPPASVLPMLMPIIQGQLKAASAIIPDKLTLVTAPLQDDPRERLRTARLFMRLSPILPILFLLTLTLLSVRTLNDWSKWWGHPLLITGVLTFITGLLGAPIIGKAVSSLLSDRLPNFLPQFLSNFTSDFASAMVRALLVPVIWQGLVLTIVGAGMVGLAIYLKRSGK
jgi:hypothetical protein